MGWAKYAEDNNEILQDRRLFSNGYNTATVATGQSEYQWKPVGNSKKRNSLPSTSHSGIKLVCKDCGKTFTFSFKSQIFYSNNGWSAPIRCEKCRDYHRICRLLYHNH